MKVYSGTLTPEGVHFFRLGLSEGEYVNMRAEFNESDFDGLHIREALDGSVHTANAQDADGYGSVSFVDRGGFDGSFPYVFSDGGEAEVWAESEPVCVGIWAEGGAGSYLISISDGDSDPPALVTEEEAEELESQARENEQIIEQQNKTIEQLQSQLAEKNPTIEQLRTQLDNQESQYSSQAQQVTENDAAVSASGPGFGAVLAVTAIVAVTLSALRRSR